MKFLRPDDPNLAKALRRDGVVFIEGLLDEAQVAEVKNALARYEAEILPSVPPAYHHYYNDGTLRSMLDLNRYDPWFLDLANRPHILGVAQGAVPWEPVVHYLESFPKPPGAGAVRAHQELQTNPIDPPHFLHLWIALSDVTAANGGMEFYRGTHKLGLAPHVSADEHVGAPSVDQELLDRLAPYRVVPDFRAGSAALFDGMTIHASGPNLSDASRPALIIAFRDTAAVIASETDNVASVVCRFFREELRVRRCDVGDSLFALGGDSLAATRIAIRLQAEYAIEVTLADIFLYSTPRELAEFVVEERDAAEAERARADRPERTPAVAPDRWHPLALSQEGFFTMDRATGGAGLFNSVLRVRFDGDLDPDALTAAIADVTRRQAVLRTVFDVHDGRPAQRATTDPPVVERLDCTGDAGRTRLRRFIREQQLTGFDLARQHPVRFALARTGAAEWSLVVTFHHIAADGWSRMVLRDDLAAAYRHRVGAAGEPAPLRVGYADFAQWQREALTGERARGHLDFLADRLSTPVTPVSPRRAERGDYVSVTQPLELAGGVMRDLAGLAAAADTTLFATLTAAVLDFAAVRTGAPSQRVVVQSANRSWPGADGLIGCFANMLCVDVRLEEGITPREAIALTTAGLTEVFPHEEMPMDHALRLLATDGVDPAAHLPDLGFGLNPPVGEPVRLPGCSMTDGLTTQPRKSIDPTTFALVAEMWQAGDRMHGLTRRLAGSWPGDSFAEAERSLTATLARYAATRPAQSGATS